MATYFKRSMRLYPHHGAMARIGKAASLAVPVPGGPLGLPIGEGRSQQPPLRRTTPHRLPLPRRRPAPHAGQVVIGTFEQVMAMLSPEERQYGMAHMAEARSIRSSLEELRARMAAASCRRRSQGASQGGRYDSPLDDVVREPRERLSVPTDRRFA